MSDIQADLAAAKERVEQLEKVAALLSDPKITILALEYLADKLPKLGVKEPTRKKKPTHFDRLLEWYASEERTSATLKEMASALGLKPSSVRQMIYSTYKSNFEKLGNVPGRNEALFRIKE